MNIYFFTRTRQYQKVKVDEERKTKSIEMLNDTLSKMYDFKDNSVKSFQAYIQGAEGARYSKRRATLSQPVPQNKQPCPSALCYYCDFGLHNKNECPFSSDWDPSKKIKR